MNLSFWYFLGLSIYIGQYLFTCYTFLFSWKKKEIFIKTIILSNSEGYKYLLNLMIN